MCLGLFILFCYFIFTNATHFNGGTIGWAPVNPYDNSTSVKITITQSYSWTYPYIKCANNVPISTSGWSGANTNLTCVVDCSTDGGYSSAPINILTDCTSTSSSLKMMTSERSKNVTLSSGAHFYLAYRGSAWVGLNDPAQQGLDWSIITYIDLRKRPDGFINTSPVAKFVSPQYAIVNKTIQINIPVSDVNAGDDVRCRWSTYTSGYRRRRRSNNEDRVEDFIDGTSIIPMSSVPVQFLIYVQSQPVCSTEPIIIPPDRCLEVQVGISISFNLSAMNLCNPSVATLTDIVVSSGITSMTHGNLTQSSTNSSIYYKTFTWTPQTNQVGSQQLCTTAYTR
ncbi:unnamed protein product [Rotaria sordida]|uniref:Uncharacterized protein n=1 Tax=Rotaria sordida TaxID=392033 RepID=A0A813YFX5_9BILA|nr:unnamed protein product [Rotaria sordida]CAF3903186.1 unnamed protein product [Rotaria sordida]